MRTKNSLMNILAVFVISSGFFLVACESNRITGPTISGPAIEVTPTPAPIPQTVTMIGAGDIGWCGLDGTAQTAVIINSTWADVVFTLGDNAYMEGSAKNFAECYDPFWGPFKNRTKPAIGNHEYETDGTASAYFSYFNLPPTKNYYSYELGNWHIVVLDTERGGLIQKGWLKGDLEGHRGQPVLIQMHRPLVSSGPNGNNPDIREVWKILEEHRVKVVLAGHDHLYERFGRLDSNGNPNPTTGIRQFIVGTGGAKLYSFGTTKPGSEFRVSVWGVLRLTLQLNSYQWEFMSGAGRVLDSGTESIS